MVLPTKLPMFSSFRLSACFKKFDIKINNQLTANWTTVGGGCTYTITRIKSHFLLLFLLNPNEKTLEYLLSGKRTQSLESEDRCLRFRWPTELGSSVSLTQPLMKWGLVLTASLNFGYRTKSSRQKRKGPKKPKTETFLLPLPWESVINLKYCPSYTDIEVK